MRRNTKPSSYSFILSLQVTLIFSFIILPYQYKVKAASQFIFPIFTPTDCMFEIPIGVVEGEDVECGYITVLEERQNPDSPITQLAVVIIKSNSPNVQPDPLFIMQGGPGGSTIETYASILLTNSRLRNDRDIILFDQRGTLYSKPDLFCEEINQLIADTLERELSQEENEQLEKEALTRCRKRLIKESINLSAYNSLENAADINDLRQVLGYEKINLYGVSYGTLLALHTMRDFPESLRSVILDAVVPPQINFITESSSSMNRSFELLFGTCASTPACNQEFPNLEEDFYGLLRILEKNPAHVFMTDPETGKIYNAVIDGETFTSGLFQMLYSSSLIPALPRMISNARDGNFDFFTQIFSIFAFDRTMSYGMYYSVLCAEDSDFDPSDQDLESLNPEIAAFEKGDAQLFLDICEIWDVDQLGHEIDSPVVSDIPTLLLSGEFDPITPPYFAETAAQTLSNSYEIIFPAAGHGSAFEGECQDKIILDFLNNPNQHPDISCIDNISTIQFYTSNNLLSIRSIFKLLNLERNMGIELLIFFLSAIFTLSTLLIFPILWSLKQNKRKLEKRNRQTPAEKRYQFNQENIITTQKRIGNHELIFLRSSNWVAISYPIILFTFIIGLCVILFEMITKNDYRIFFGIPAACHVWFILMLFLLLLGLTMLIISLISWKRNYWSIWRKVYYSLITISTLINIFILSKWGFVSAIFQ